MGSYRLSEDAKVDLIRIYRRGVREFGEAQAEAYFNAFFERFDMLAEKPLAYPAVDEIRVGYRRSVCGADSIYYRVTGDCVEVMAIIGQQDLDDWLTIFLCKSVTYACLHPGLNRPRLIDG